MGKNIANIAMPFCKQMPRFCRRMLEMATCPVRDILVCFELMK